MREIAADRRLLPDPDGRDRRERGGERRRVRADRVRSRERTVGRERPEPQAPDRAGRVDRAQLREAAKSDDARGPDELLLHQDDQRRPAGHDERVLGVFAQERQGLIERVRLAVLERPHRIDRAVAIARAIP